MKKLVLYINILVSLNNVYSQAVGEDVFLKVEEMPIFKEHCLKYKDVDQCNISEIHTYASSVDYPEIIVNNNIEGKVYIQFKADKDGSIIDVKVLRGSHELLDEIAKRHFQNMPKFYRPGYQRGKPVKVLYNIPINFSLKGYKNKVSKRKKKEFKKQLEEFRKELFNDKK